MWTGGIQFGLVYIPIQLFSASADRSVKFHFLDKKDNSRIHYSKYRESDGKEVTKDDIVRGFEYEKGKHVILDDEDFESAHVEKSNSISIHEFVSEDEIDSVYFEKPYYLVPDENAAETYALLTKALRKAKRVGVATYVVREREHLGIIKAENGMLILSQMRYHSEIKDPKDVGLPIEANVKAEELRTAVQIIEKLSGTFDPKKYKDTYTNDLMKIIEQKQKGKKVVAKGSKPEATEVVDIMKELQESLKKAKKKA